MAKVIEVPQAVAQPAASLLWLIPWGHHALLLERVKETSHRVWYMRQTLTHGWSRNVLGMMLSSDAHRRQGPTVNNFDLRLPAPQSELVQQSLKDPYILRMSPQLLKRRKG